MNSSNLTHHYFRRMLSIIVLSAICAGVLGLPRPAQASPVYVLDNFSTAAYANQDGPASWTTDWLETNDDDNAATGDVLISGGELRLNNSLATGSFESIERQVSMPVNATATLTYDHRDTNLEFSDTLILEIFDGDAMPTPAWTTLATFNGNIADGPRTYDISNYRSANTRIRFRISAGFTMADEFFYADNVRIDYWSANTHGSTSVFPTVQTYYIPVPEDQALLMLDAVNPAALDPMILYASITVNSSGTIIYYDHREDDFEIEIANPQQNTSEVWGDNNPANGVPPGYTTDVLNAGNVIVLNNEVATTALDLIDFDGGDKIASTDAIAVTRTSWASGSGTLHGGSVEMLDTSVWGTRFDVPADAGDQANDFDYAGLAVMASMDNTQVLRNGTLVATIDEGQSYLFNDNVNGGDKITASAPVQANFLTGNIGSNYESSWYTLYPFDLLSSSYYAPVDSTGAVNTAVFIQNPNAAVITVHWTTTGGARTDIGPIAAGATARVIMPNTGTGARFYTGTGLDTDPHFQAIATINSGGQDNDWGYTLIPANQLTQQAMVGWGVGRDPTSGTLPNENGSPVWVVAVGSGTMKVCADYDGDRAGALVDANGSHYDQLINLTHLARAKVYDTDGDQTGMLLYLCHGSETGNLNKIAVAWGQDPATASPGDPGLDVGTSIPPLPNFTSNKNARLVIDLNRDTLFDVGETFEYRIEINNVGALPIPANTIRVSDIVPQYTLYVPNSTAIVDSNTGLTTAIPDEAAPPKLTACPLDEGGYLIPQQLWIDQKFTVIFRVRIDATLPGLTRIQNSASVNGLNLTYDPSVEILVQPPDLNSRIGDTLWLDRNGNGAQDAGEPGLPGVTVELRDSFCIPNSTCLTDVTDANGEYSFPNLINNTYTVVVRPATLPAGLTQTGDPDGAFDSQHTIVLTDLNKPYADADFGYQGNASIGDFVWNDLDGNGVYNTGESGINGVTVWVDWDTDGVQDATEPNAVTDANGHYFIGGLPAGTFAVRSSGTPIDGATATFDVDGVGTSGAASVTLAVGQNRADVDWGYQIAALSIGKISSAAGEVRPGETITYTVVARNNTASRHSGIVINDAAPAGTTFGTGTVTGYKLYEYRDDFVAGSGYNQTGGLSNWSANAWVETNDDASPTGGTIRLASDELRLQGANGGSIQRTIPGNLTGQTVTLEIDYRETGSLEAADEFHVEMWNGSSWSAVISQINDFGDPVAETVDISAYARNGDTQIRIRSTYNGGTEAVYVAYVRVYYTTTIVGATLHTPPGLVVAGDNFGLYPDQSMTVTYQVTVNDPVTGGLTGINNTATVASTQQSAPQAASTSDRLPQSTIGDRVWLDEDGDGDQDAGEAGIPNVTVELRNGVCTPGGNCPTTLTDAHGNYLFMGVVPGSYTVAVGNGLPAGLAANPTFDEDGVGTAHSSVAALSAGQAYRTADFGYNWASTSETGSNSGLGAIGDRLWIDANGDGRQDINEAGLSGVSVQLLTPGADGVFGTADDVIASTTTTGAAGNYIFDGLAAGAYVVRVNGGTAPIGYGQTGDPDHYGVIGVNDNQTTTPILLAPGDVYVNADFGYQSTSGGHTIGNTLFLDSNGDGLGAGELGLAGVHIALLDGNQAIIATTITDGSGQYGFYGLPDITYTVWVNDTSNILGNLIQTGTPDAVDGGQPCGVCNGRSSVTLSGADNILQDFGYAPANHTGGDGLIGDTIFLDANNSGAPEAGEGLEGVSVRLYDATGTTRLASTTTNKNGQYFFGDLPAATYVVRVTAPAGYANITDPDSGTANESTVVLGIGATNLTQDFGYRWASGTVGNLVWNDLNANGLVDGGEPGLDGVTVELYQDHNANGLLDANDTLIGEATTSGGGAYSFGGLASDDGGGNAQYLVMVTDADGVLTGWWASTGTIGADNNSQSDPYAITLTPAAAANSTADFGYSMSPAALGNFVWLDRNNDGVQQAVEPGIAGVTVTLTIIWPGGAGTSTLTARTDAAGHYTFGNLLADEHFDGAGAGEPTFSISVTPPTSMNAAPQNQAGEDLDSDNPAGQSATVLKGAIDNGYDFGFYTPRLDLGDAPNAYQTLFGQGAAHIVFPDGGDGRPDTTGGRPAVWLGSIVDVEADGQPTTDAKGDGADEDGLTFKSSDWVAGGTSIITVTLNASQSGVRVYLGLWIDWDQDSVFEAFYPGSGVSGSPVAAPINVSIPASYAANRPVYFRVRADDAPLISTDWSGTLVNGEVEDYQLTFSPTAVNLASFTAAQNGDHNTIAWETASELHNLGFNLWRGLSSDGPTAKLNELLIPSQAPGSTEGFAYHYDDFDIEHGATYYYWLEDVDLDGTITRHGPVQATTVPTAVTLTSLAASSSTSAVPPQAVPWMVLPGAVMLMSVVMATRRRK